MQSPVSAETVSALFAPVTSVVRAALGDALSRPVGETGRLTYPPGDTSTPCDVRVLPTAGDVHLALAPNGNYVLQVGFGRPGSMDIPSLPTALPAGSLDTRLRIGNRFLLELLRCLLRRLPAFALPAEGSFSTDDVKSNQHLMCLNFTDWLLTSSEDSPDFTVGRVPARRSDPPGRRRAGSGRTPVVPRRRTLASRPAHPRAGDRARR